MEAEQLKHLFSSEALNHQRFKSFGSTTLVQPLTTSLLSALLALIVAVALLFMVVGEYARRETVAGYLEPEWGLIPVYPSLSTATLTEIFVEEGEHVQRGELLARLRADDVATNNKLRQEFQHQLSGLEYLLQNLDTTKALQQTQLDLRLAHLNKQIQRYDHMQFVLSRRSKLLEEQLDAATVLLTQRAASATQWSQVALQRDDAEHEVISAALGREQLEGQVAQLQKQMAILHATTAAERARLQLQQSQVVQALAQHESRTSQQVRAPLAGKVTGIQKQLFESTTADQPLLSLVPDDSELVGRLLIPGSAIGFVEPGSSVRLSVDAFPQQEFGTVSGQILTVSQAPVSPTELDSPVPVAGPVYIATVQLLAQAIESDGQIHTLLPGLLVRADLILERRSLLAWLLEPLYVLRGRTQ